MPTELQRHDGKVNHSNIGSPVNLEILDFNEKRNEWADFLRMRENGTASTTPPCSRGCIEHVPVV